MIDDAAGKRTLYFGFVQCRENRRPELRLRNFANQKSLASRLGGQVLLCTKRGRGVPVLISSPLEAASGVFPKKCTNEAFAAVHGMRCLILDSHPEREWVQADALIIRGISCNQIGVHRYKSGGRRFVMGCAQQMLALSGQLLLSHFHKFTYNQTDEVV